MIEDDDDDLDLFPDDFYTSNLNDEYEDCVGSKYPSEPINFRDLIPTTILETTFVIFRK